MYLFCSHIWWLRNAHASLHVKKNVILLISLTHYTHPRKLMVQAKIYDQKNLGAYLNNLNYVNHPSFSEVIQTLAAFSLFFNAIF